MTAQLQTKDEEPIVVNRPSHDSNTNSTLHMVKQQLLSGLNFYTAALSSPFNSSPTHSNTGIEDKDKIEEEQEEAEEETKQFEVTKNKKLEENEEQYQLYNLLKKQKK